MDSKDTEILSNSEIPESVRVAIVQRLADSDNEKTSNQLELAKLELERKKVFLNTPLVAALAGLITLSATFIFGSITKAEDTKHTITLEQIKQELESSEARLSQQLAEKTTRTDAEIEALAREREFQYEIVKSELADGNKSNVERASVLLFLAKAGILNTLNQEELQKMAIEQKAKPEENIIPRLQVSSSSKILAGNEVINISDAPWQAALMAKMINGPNGQFYGAVLISDKWALTTAHCVSSLKPEDIYLNYGSLNYSNSIKNDVVKIHLHPKCENKMSSFDAALLELENKIGPIEPIELVKTGKSLPIGDFMRVFGWWSLTAGGSIVKNMMYVDLPIISDRQCKLVMSDDPSKIDSSSMFCAGQPERGFDVCQGSGGSSAVIKSSERKYKLVGMPSWGRGCGESNSFGVYTRVSSITDWAYGIMNANYRGPGMT